MLIITQLDKLQKFEELDRQLVGRIGVHLQDVGELSSPALSQLLRETAPSGAGTTSQASSVASNNQADPLLDDIHSLLGSDFLSGSSKASVNEFLQAAQAERAAAERADAAAAAAAGLKSNVHVSASSADGQGYFPELGAGVDRSATSPAPSNVSSMAAWQHLEGGDSNTDTRGGHGLTKASGKASVEHITPPSVARGAVTTSGTATTPNSTTNSGTFGGETMDAHVFVPSPISAIPRDASGPLPWDSNGAGPHVLEREDDDESDNGTHRVSEDDVSAASGGAPWGEKIERSASGTQFDERAFAEQEARMRDAYEQRRGSVENVYSSASSSLVSNLGPGPVVSSWGSAWKDVQNGGGDKQAKTAKRSGLLRRAASKDSSHSAGELANPVVRHG